MRVLIGGLGTLGANFLFTLLRTNNLNKDWNLSLVDYDKISSNDLKHIWYSNIDKSKIVECIRLIYKIHNPKVNINDFSCGKMEDYLNETKHEFNLALDFRDNNDDFYNLNSNYYFKGFINSQYGILLNEVDSQKFRYNPKEYDSKPFIWNSVHFCNKLINILDSDKIDTKSFMFDFDVLKRSELVCKEEYGNKIIEIKRS